MPTYGLPSSIEQLMVMLERSQDAPLDVQLHICGNPPPLKPSPSSEIPDTLASTAHSSERYWQPPTIVPWRHLTSKCSVLNVLFSDYSAAEHFLPLPLPIEMPHLQKLAISRSNHWHPQKNQSISFLPTETWLSLTDFEICGHILSPISRLDPSRLEVLRLGVLPTRESFVALSEFLEQTQCLRSLSLYASAATRKPLDFVPSTITMASVTSLSVESESPALLYAIRAPIATHLHISDLHTSYQRITADDLESYFQQVTNLQSLCITAVMTVFGGSNQGTWFTKNPNLIAVTVAERSLAPFDLKAISATISPSLRYLILVQSYWATITKDKGPFYILLAGLLRAYPNLCIMCYGFTVPTDALNNKPDVLRRLKLRQTNYLGSEVSAQDLTKPTAEAHLRGDLEWLRSNGIINQDQELL